MPNQMPSFDPPAHPRWQQLMNHFVQNYQPAYNPQVAMQQYAPQLQQAAYWQGKGDYPAAGAEVPYEQHVLNNLNTVAMADGVARLPMAIAEAPAMIADFAGSAPRMLGNEAGAIFPDAAKAGEDLPVMQPGSKTGDPHALFAYNDNFSPDGSPRAIYNVFGDPAHPAIQTRGWGSSVSKSDLDKLGIPVIGRQPNAVGVEPAP